MGNSKQLPNCMHCVGVRALFKRNKENKIKIHDMRVEMLMGYYRILHTNTNFCCSDHIYFGFTGILLSQMVVCGRGIEIMRLKISNLG